MGSKSNGSVYFRSDSSVVWIRYVHPVNGKVQTSLPELRRDVLGVDECKRQARAVLDQILTDIANGVEVSTGPLTLEQWFRKRVTTRPQGRKELAMLIRHAGAIKSLPLTALTPKVLGDWVKSLRGAPRSVWHRWSNVRTALGDAAIAGHIVAVPPLPRGCLPKKVDANPEWRIGAIYTLRECEMLMSDERIPFARRVLYALKALTGGRHGECVGLTWDRIDWHAQPLPMIILSRQYTGARTKTLATKTVPVHPALNAILTAWRAHVTEQLGREPAGDDFIVPPAGERIMRRPLTSDANPELAADLQTLGLRVRDGHDFRATFVTELLKSASKAGIPEHVAKSITHAVAVVRDAYDAYKRVPYSEQCEAMLTLRVRPIMVVSYGQATAGGNNAESGAFSESFGMTVLPNEIGQGQSRSNDSRGLRIVPANLTYLERSGTDLDRSTVAATDRDRRIEAVEAQVKLLLDELARLRK
jgi:integrase